MQNINNSLCVCGAERANEKWCDIIIISPAPAPFLSGTGFLSLPTFVLREAEEQKRERGARAAITSLN